MADSYIKTTFSRLDLSSVKVPFILSLCNQLISSGGNFLIGVYLARTLSLEGFGLYGLGYGMCMLYVSIGNALLLTQMVVNMPDRLGDEKRKFAGKIFCAVALMGVLALTLTTACFFLSLLVEPEYYQYMPSVFAVALASVLFLCNEFFISYAYQKRQETLALVVNALTIVTLFIALSLEKIMGIPLSPEHVLLFYALGAAIGSCVAYVTSPLPLREGLKNLKPELVEAWSHGRWALGGAVITWIQAQAYTYVLAFFLGPAGVGQANAARIFISPFSFFLPAINKVAIPRLADLRQSDPQRMFRVSIMLTLWLSSLTIIYTCILLFSLDFVVKIVVGRQDARIESVVWAWCLVLIFQMIRSCGAVLLQVQKKFRVLMLVNIPTAIITVISALALIHWFGAVGSVLGMASGEFVLASLIWREIKLGTNKKS
ncbi:MAG: lipopolysaccharide biosynthesis protein [Burkholderiaceae bacterium]